MKKNINEIEKYNHCFSHWIYKYPQKFPIIVPYDNPPEEYDLVQDRWPSSPGKIYYILKGQQ